MTIKGKLTNQQIGAMGINRTDNGQNKPDECQIEKKEKEEKNKK